MSKHTRSGVLVWLVLAIAGTVSGQYVSLKSNLLYDAMTTPNLGVECSTGRDQSVNLVYGINAWKFGGGDNFAKHWVLMPEYRWWLCSVYNGHFFGVHAMGGEFDAQRAHLPVPGGFLGGDNLTRGIRHNRYEGAYAGIGATYGYQWILNRHWNLEVEVGAGYGHVWYRKYDCAECGNKLKNGHSNYAGLTKLGLSIMYLF